MAKKRKTNEETVTLLRATATYLMMTICAMAVTAQGVRGYALDDPDVMQSSTPHFEAIRDGLSSLYCRNMVEDRDGYLWVSTTNGITRYDGQRTRTFAMAEFDGAINSDCDINSLTEDTISNCIWGSHTTQQRLVKIDRRTFDVTYIDYEMGEGDSKNKKMMISSLLPMSDTTLLGFSVFSVFIVDKRTGGLKRVKEPPLNVRTSITQFFNIRGKDYAVYGASIYEIDWQAGDSVCFRQVMKELGPVNKVVVDKDEERLYFERRVFGGEHNVATYNLRTGEIRDLPKIETNLNLVYDIAKDGVWMGTNQGLYFQPFETDTAGEMLPMRHFSSNNSQLHDNNIKCIHKMRRQPIIMVGTKDGMAKINYLTSKFVTTDTRKASRSASADVTTLYKDSHGGYWCWMLDGLFHHDADKHIFERVDVGGIAVFGNRSTGICETDAQDGVYLAQNDRIVKLSYDGTRGETIYTSKESGLFNKTMPIGGTKMAILAQHALKIFDTRTRRCETIDLEREGISSTTSNTCNDKRHLWIIDNDNELYCIDLETKESRKYGHINQKTILRFVHTESEGIDELWFLTRKDGIVYYLPDPGERRQITTSKALLSPQSITVDKNGGIWVGTSTGIVNIKDAQTTEFLNTEFDIIETFNNHATAVAPDGDVLMGGPKGFVEFNVERYAENEYYPAPRIESYELSNSVNDYYDSYTRNETVFGGDTIVIPPGIRSVRLHISTLNFDRPSLNKFIWRLDNNEEWRQSSVMSELLLTNLNEGTHTLHMRSLNQNGGIGVEETVTCIERDVFFFEKRWFVYAVITMSVMLIVLLGGLYGIHTQRRRRLLEQEVAKQAGVIIQTNKDLMRSQNVIRQQYRELAEVNNSLERKVAERTADLESAKQKAEESSQLKSAFLASLSHEVRTPMNAIIGFAKLLELPDCANEERIEFGHLIMECSNSMLSIIGGLLDTSRIERGVLPITKSEFDIDSEIQDIYRIMSVEKHSNTVEYLLKAGEEMKGRRIYTDRDRLRQVIINITYNAFKFTDDGFVQMTANVVGGEKIGDLPRPARVGIPNAEVLLVTIEDTGIGIPDDKLEAVFEPFRRLTNNKMKYGGMGLGLGIVKNVCQLLGGDVWVTSELGRGSTFSFYIPMSDKE